ncbi:prepilin-type N-terminal cleavage/methylation domain-containing protein [Aliiroseovarius sp. CAU 1755]
MNARAGYSLLEVLIAFAVMAVVLAVVLPGQSTQLRLAGKAQDRFLATSYAQSRLDQLGVTEELLVGHIRETYRDWEIEVNVSAVQGQSGSPEYYQVEIQIMDRAGRLLATHETVKVSGQ